MKMTEFPEKSFYLASYPRSGNTWLIYSLSMLLGAVCSEALSTFHLYPYRYSLSSNRDFFIVAEEPLDDVRPLIIKTHTNYEDFIKTFPRLKCIYVYRDVRDVMLSYYFFRKAMADEGKIIFERVGVQRVINARCSEPCKFDAEEFADFLRQHVQEWVAHVESWLSNNDTFTVSYEDLSTRYSDVLKNIVGYLNIDPVKDMEEVINEYTVKFRRHFNSGNQGVFRRGIVGDWKNYYSMEHCRIVQEAAGDLMAQLGYNE